MTNNSNKIDYLIIGQGLAGSVLALELLHRKKRVMVIDRPDNNYSSSVAAGLFNPITGRVMAKTWKADLLFPCLHTFYSSAEKILGQRFFYSMPLYRPFLSIEEQNEWMIKSDEAGMNVYVKEIYTRAQFAHHVSDPYGGLLLSQCGYIDVNGFMDSVRNKLIHENSFRAEYFEEEKLTINENGLAYNDYEANKIVYCNGIEAMQSRFFKGLPFKPLKGETLGIQLGEEPEHIYNRGVYVVPTNQKGYYKVGATYNGKDNSHAITLAGKEELTIKLKDLIKIPYTITTQQWGIRPTTTDRRPILGAHPKYGSIIIFNGLGTKGVSLAPYFAEQLANWLSGAGKIDPEANISRFKFL